MGKPTSLSAVFLPGGTAAFGSSLAVDGRSQNRIHDPPGGPWGNCMKTATEFSSWWKVDLGGMHIVYSVTVFGVTDNRKKLL